MINSKMRNYDYYLLNHDNGYGQLVVLRDTDGKPVKQGDIKLSISTLTQAVVENIRYSDATYIGLTHDFIDDTYLIQYGNEVLKVLYVNKDGRYTQVYFGIYER